MTKNRIRKYSQFSSIILILNGLICTTHPIQEAAAEAVPDNSLGTEASTVTPNLNINNRPASLIQGGAVRNATTVFHSFERFNVPENQAIYFDNPAGINTIVSRVTGNQPSNIAGTLGVWNSIAGTLGNADLFFINSRGIAFGPNAALDLNGSFLASTATSINFGDEYQFSTINPSAPPLLTINLPTGLQFSAPGATIASQAGFNFPIQTTFGLTVTPGNTLALVGGNVTLQGGNVEAPQGRIELGSVLSGEVNLQPSPRGWALDYSKVQSFQDIHLDQQSSLNANDVGSGEIRVQGRQIVLNDRSNIFALVTFGSEPGGTVEINAADSLQMSNGSRIATSTLADGDAGDILIKANRVSLLNNSAIVTDSSFINFGTFQINATGDSGNIQITAPELVEISGNSQISTTTTTSGNAGLISIDTGTFIAKDALTVPAIRSVAEVGSEGRAGNINVTATQHIQIDQSSLSTETAGLGDAGNINIVSPQLLLTNGGQLLASTFGPGTGGNISVTVQELTRISGRHPDTGQPSGIFSVVDPGALGDGGQISVATSQFNLSRGGQISTSTAGFGNAGKIDIRALQEVSLTDPGTGVLANTTAGSNGAAGSIFIDPIQVLIANGATVSVNSQGSGMGGDIQLRARNLTLNRGQITAEAKVARAGDIQLDIDNLLLLRNGSLISTTAGGDATGGNIDIDANLIVAFPQENSDITANALNGPGGRITITTTGIFGLAVRDSLTNSSDITAFSQNNPQLNGMVEINTPEVDPSENLSEQPEAVEPPSEIAQGCKAQVASSSFVYKGRGGLPQNPATSMGGDAVWRDLRPLQAQTSGQPLGKSSPQSTAGVASVSSLERVEAKGWRRLPNGKVMLVAQAVNHSSLPPVASC